MTAIDWDLRALASYWDADVLAALHAACGTTGSSTAGALVARGMSVGQVASAMRRLENHGHVRVLNRARGRRLLYQCTDKGAADLARWQAGERA